MPKATIKLASGAVVNIAGTVADIKELLSFYGGLGVQHEPRAKTTASRPTPEKAPAQPQKEKLSLTEIVRQIKDCDEAEDMERRILDTTSQINRILLPLFIVYRYMSGKYGLTSGDISAITKELGIPIHVANVSNALTSSTKRYVIGDTVRRQGQPVRYKLSRRGAKYIENVIKGKSDDE